MWCGYLTGHTSEALQLSSLVPRLWPFLSHTSKAVRQSCLQVLLSLVNTGERGTSQDITDVKGRLVSTDRGCEQNHEGMEVSGGGVEEDTERVKLQREAEGQAGDKERNVLPWLSGILQGALCHLFQRLVLEGDRSNMTLTQQVRVRIL